MAEDKDTDLKERIKQLIRYYNLNDAAFAHKIQTNRSTLSQCLNGTNGVSKEIISKIHIAYPDVHTDWLLYGEGEPFKKQVRNPFSFTSKNEIFRPDDGNVSKYGKDSGVKSGDNSRQTSDDKTKTGNISIENADLQQRENKRVVKIIVYYSDNTFEPYSPDK